METTQSQERVGRETAGQPVPYGFSHVAVRVRDQSEAARFFTEVLGAELIYDRPTFTEVSIGGIVIGFTQSKGSPGDPNSEFPHYAFLVDGDNMIRLKERLEAHGVPTHPIWTRRGVEALMYFRDPSDNLYELYCVSGFPDADKLPRRGSDGFAPPISELSYEWKG